MQTGEWSGALDADHHHGLPEVVARRSPFPLHAGTIMSSATHPPHHDARHHQPRHPFCGIEWLPLALILCSLLLVLIPPLKSPDEMDHIKRAYLLSEGQWLLQTQPCSPDSAFCRNGQTMSGGFIDSGLAEYLEILSQTLSQPSTRIQDLQTRYLRWTGQPVFQTASSTGYYLPLSYLPQAAAFKAAKALDLSITRSVTLARIVSMVATLTVLWLAFRLHRPLPIVVAILLLPMWLFQLASASLDPFSTALAVLALSCFVRLMKRDGEMEWPSFIAMTLSLFVVVTSRTHLLPMLLMPVVVAWRTRLWSAWGMTLLAMAGAAGWLAIALSSTVDFRVLRAVSSGDIALYYLRSPGELLGVFARTLRYAEHGHFMQESFAGYFHYIKALPRDASNLLTLLLVLAMLCSLASWQQCKKALLARSTLILMGLVSVVLAYLAMLIVWTPHPADRIEGMQGRYLAIPVMMILMGISSWYPPPAEGWKAWPGKCRPVLMILLLGCSLVFLADSMVSGFRTPWAAHRTPVADTRVPGTLERTAQLRPGQPVPLHLPVAGSPSTHDGDGNGDGNHEAGRAMMATVSSKPVKQVMILFATYGQRLGGQARLNLTTDGGQSFSRTFRLHDVREKKYYPLNVTPAIYRHGSLEVASGHGGVSIWEHVANDAESTKDSASVLPPPQTCLVLIHTDDTSSLTPGCPAP